MTALAGYRRAATPSGQRMQLLAGAALVALSLLGVVVTVTLLGGAAAQPWQLALGAVAVVALGALAGTSVRLRRQSSRILGAATAVAALAVIVVAGLGVVVLLLGRLPTDQEQSLVLPVAGAIAVGALLLPPVRRWLAATVRRSASGPRRPPEEVLETFGDRSMRDVPIEEQLLRLAESLRHGFALSAVEIWTGGDSGLTRLLSVPHRAAALTSLGPEEVEVARRAGVAGEAWLRLWLPGLLAGRGNAQLRVAAVTHAGELLGLVLVERAPDAERFTGTDERSLGELVRRLGVVLHNRQLDSALQATLDDLRRTNDELRASRTRLVATADAERRRIERDIHDGAQQHLAALAVNLGLVRQILADDPETATELLDEMSTDVRATIQQVRDLAHGIYPPLLREAGLEEALRAAAARRPLNVTVDAPDLPRHDPDVEAAVYFCCLEALQNTAKHAPESAVKVRVWRDQSTLCFQVSDDGPGFDRTEIAPGHGFQNMADRLGAIGGVVRWSSAPGAGTQVHGEIPLGGAA